MKKIIKLLPLLLLVFAIGCDEDDTERFKVNSEAGWIEFATGTSGETVTIITEEVILPVRVRVPIFENGITVNYTLEAVEGDFSTIVSTGTSVTLEPSQAGPNGSPFVVNIPLVFEGIADLDEIIVFDVVLNGTSINGIAVGLDENSITRYRISTPCPLDVAALQGTYDVAEVFTSGINEGLSLAAAFGQSYQVEVIVDPDDPTQTNFILTNSIGFDQYFVDGNIATMDSCNGTVSFTTPLNLGDFADMTVLSSSYTESPAVITADGTLGNFGPYQFVLTKQ